ncbi:MAG TPA: V-type ATP synthase subunit F [Gemmatimonadaceae bacterium]|jgi:vacuolar-type H+-ATPase subunit F/Vma7|nr:V-type ATP synthase subunit F [Gemmatimonadaceae bacterium]
MSYRVRAVATPALAAGLRLAALPCDEAASAADAADRVAELTQAPELGILLIEQSLFDALPAAQRRDLEHRSVPIVVPIPRVSWEEEPGIGEAYILDLLRRAIGYRVRLQ